MKPTRILFTAAEMTPLAKAGGLGDVIGALPHALHGQVDSLVVALPFHEHIAKAHLRQLRRIDTVTVRVRNKAVTVTIWKAIAWPARIPMLLFKQPDFLSRGEIYDGRAVLNPLTGRLAVRDGLGQRLRYLFFAYALHAYLLKHPKEFTIIHAHDFHVASLLALIHHEPALAHLKTILTIHNLAYTGPLAQPYWEIFTPNIFHLFHTAEAKRPLGPRMLWLGIRWADSITTVSPQYAKEILTPEYGNDFELLLQKRQRQLFGILNGLDTELFDPASDSSLYRNFTVRTVQRRSDNKIFLQRRCGLPIDPKIPVIGMVARLTTQKGVKLIINAMSQLAMVRAQFVICGTGPKHYTEPFQEMAERHPERWYFHNAFDTVFSQYVYAGCDIFLMPSRHEPCGLAQLIAMRYGAVPVVRATGGLKDTVHDGKNGFVFAQYSSAALVFTMKRAFTSYRSHPTRWQHMIEHGMKARYGWDTSAKAYVHLYTKLLKSSPQLKPSDLPIVA